MYGGEEESALDKLLVAKQDLMGLKLNDLPPILEAHELDIDGYDPTGSRGQTDPAGFNTHKQRLAEVSAIVNQLASGQAVSSDKVQQVKNFLQAREKALTSHALKKAGDPQTALKVNEIIAEQPPTQASLQLGVQLGFGPDAASNVQNGLRAIAFRKFWEMIPTPGE